MFHGDAVGHADTRLAGVGAPARVDGDLVIPAELSGDGQHLRAVSGLVVGGGRSIGSDKCNIHGTPLGEIGMESLDFQGVPAS
ncbi:hypothetical protein Psi01_57200 [Planobispora siamensis]|uniref:Uncharacterized protein n=1 Tax=Planobispora siamensis TaxID=936338 RepID=A0A8J3WMW7_9ACTN|nr:hypothetical protein Psi01_57200 [Planobispora siamensis]